jgi:hypothetical protein
MPVNAYDDYFGYDQGQGGWATTGQGMDERTGLPQVQGPKPGAQGQDPFTTVGYQGLGYSNNNDPYGYTFGSFMTPWTQPLPSLPSIGGGSGSVQMAPFHYNDLNYSFGAAPSYTAATFADRPAFNYGAYASPQSLTAGTFNPNAFSFAQMVPQYNRTTPQAMTPDRYAAAAPFQAPTLDETNDPGYAFRLREGNRAIANAASSQGIRGGDVAKAFQDYAQNYASAEYGNVYNRAFGAYNANEANRLSAFQTDTQAQLAAQAQQYQQAYSDYQAQLAAQGQGFGQAQSTYGMNEDNRFRATQFNQDEAFRVQQANEANRLNAYNANWTTAAGVNDRNFNQALQTYQANEGNRFNAASLTSQNINAANSLGWDVASGSYDRNYQNALNTYQMAYQQANAAAGAASSAASADYNRQMAQYGTAYDIFNQNQTNQFNRQYSMALLGQNAANTLTGAAGQYAGNYGNLVGQGANANAAAGMGSANAWAGLAGNMGNNVGSGLIMGSPMSGLFAPAPRLNTRTANDSLVGG